MGTGRQRRRILLTELLYTGEKSGIWEGGPGLRQQLRRRSPTTGTPQFTFTKSTTDPNGFTWSAVPGPEGDTFAAITSADTATFTEGIERQRSPRRPSGTPTPTITETGTLPTGVTFTGGVLTG